MGFRFKSFVGDVVYKNKAVYSWSLTDDEEDALQFDHPGEALDVVEAINDGNNQTYERAMLTHFNGRTPENMGGNRSAGTYFVIAVFSET